MQVVYNCIYAPYSPTRPSAPRIEIHSGWSPAIGADRRRHITRAPTATPRQIRRRGALGCHPSDVAVLGPHEYIASSTKAAAEDDHDPACTPELNEVPQLCRMSRASAGCADVVKVAPRCHGRKIGGSTCQVATRRQLGRYEKPGLEFEDLPDPQAGLARPGRVIRHSPISLRPGPDVSEISRVRQQKIIAAGRHKTSIS